MLGLVVFLLLCGATTTTATATISATTSTTKVDGLECGVKNMSCPLLADLFDYFTWTVEGKNTSVCSSKKGTPYVTLNYVDCATTIFDEDQETVRHSVILRAAATPLVSDIRCTCTFPLSITHELVFNETQDYGEITTTTILTVTTTAILTSHEVSGSFTMNVSDNALNLDEAGQASFVNLIEKSIAHLLGISSQYVSVTVQNFLDGRRRLSMTHQLEGRHLMPRRRLALDLLISYTVSTTEDQVSSVSDQLTSTVQTGIADTLNSFIAEYGTINVTVHGLTHFETPTFTEVSSTNISTDDSDKTSTKSIIIVSVCVGSACSLWVCVLLLLRCKVERWALKTKKVTLAKGAEDESNVVSDTVDPVDEGKIIQHCVPEMDQAPQVDLDDETEFNQQCVSEIDQPPQVDLVDESKVSQQCVSETVQLPKVDLVDYVSEIEQQCSLSMCDIPTCSLPCSAP